MWPSVREGRELGPRTLSATVANSVTAQYFYVGEHLMEIFFYVIVFLNEGIELNILQLSDLENMSKDPRLRNKNF